MGAVQILTYSMVQSIEENSVRKGYDPRDFALVAEGGAGPLFAAQIALEVGTPTVVVPPYPGIAAAMGLLATDMVYEYVATTYQRLSRLDAPRSSAASRNWRRWRAHNSPRTASPRTIVDPADRRVPLPRPGLRAPRGHALGAIDDAWAEKVRADFHDIHEREYSRRFEESDIQIPNIRVRGIGLTPALRMPEIEQGDDSPDAALRHEGAPGSASAARCKQVPTRYYERAALKAGNRLVGRGS